MKLDRTILRAVEGRILAARRARGLRAGERKSPHRGRGLEFADYRPYDAGDDVRLVDWKVFSRLGEALVRLFEEERQLRARVVLDTSGSMAFDDKAHHAAHVAAALVMAAQSGGDSVELRCGRARATGRSFAPFLSLLERTEAKGDEAPLLHGNRVDRTLLVSDVLIDAAEQQALLKRLAASSHEPVLVHVLGQGELNPDLRNAGRLVDSETGEELSIRGGTLAKSDYDAALKAWLDGVRLNCKRLRITYVQAFVGDSLDEDLARAGLVA